jgi:hypothetical protein
LLFIFCGIFGAIFNPKSMWSGNDVGRVENFLAHAWPISVAPGVFNMLLWPLGFMVVFVASFIRPLMSEAMQFLGMIILLGIAVLFFGFIFAGELAPILLGDGCGMIFFAIMTAREIRRQQWLRMKTKI